MEHDVIVVGDGLVGASIAAGLSAQGLSVAWLGAQEPPRRPTPGLAVPDRWREQPHTSRDRLDRYDLWLSLVSGYARRPIPFQRLPVACDQTPGLIPANTTFGVVDTAALWRALRAQAESYNTPFRVDTAATPRWENGRVVGLTLGDGSLLAAREVVLARGLRPATLWMHGGASLERVRDRVLIETRSEAQSWTWRYLFPWGDTVCQSVTPDDPGAETPTTIGGIVPVAPRDPVSTFRYAPGLIYSLLNGSHGLLHLPWLAAQAGLMFGRLPTIAAAA